MATPAQKDLNRLNKKAAYERLQSITRIEAEAAAASTIYEDEFVNLNDPVDDCILRKLINMHFCNDSSVIVLKRITLS